MARFATFLGPVISLPQARTGPVPNRFPETPKYIDPPVQKILVSFKVSKPNCYYSHFWGNFEAIGVRGKYFHALHISIEIQIGLNGTAVPILMDHGPIFQNVYIFVTLELVRTGPAANPDFSK